jgi:hypothetical protein
VTSRTPRSACTPGWPANPESPCCPCGGRGPWNPPGHRPLPPYRSSQLSEMASP